MFSLRNPLSLRNSVLNKYLSIANILNYKRNLWFERINYIIDFYSLIKIGYPACESLFFYTE